MSSNNILKDLFQRELTGRRLFKKEKSIPKLRMKIDTIIPKSALQAGHIIMGFTLDNSKIISYTIRPATNLQPLQYEDQLNQSINIYTLHFWNFIPYKLSKLLYSVKLFDRNGIPDPNLNLQICQEKSLKKILVIGTSNNDTTQCSTLRCYLTLTELPNLKCRKCFFKQKLIPCDEHSLTLSINYELVPPYPLFDPTVQLLNDSNSPVIILNTGNLIHRISNQNELQKNLLKCEIYLEKNPSTIILNHYNNLSLKNRQKKFFKRSKPVLKNVNTVGVEKPTIYDINPHEQSEQIEKNYKNYRKRRLADKKYEFIDDDELNVKKRKENQPFKIINLKCTTKITRSYKQFDDETSTTTSIEEDQQDYPVALPIELYTNFTQLHMVRNHSNFFDKIVVKQNTLDLEILSNEVANFVCQLEDFIFGFLIDFDCHILETSPTGCITAIVIILIQGTNKQSESSESYPRQKYETSFTFTWSPSTTICKILYKSKLKEVSNKNDAVWNPTKEFNHIFKMHRVHSNEFNVTQLNNRNLIEEWTSVEELTDWSGIVTLYRENTNNSTFTSSSSSSETDEDF